MSNERAATAEYQLIEKHLEEIYTELFAVQNESDSKDFEGYIEHIDTVGANYQKRLNTIKRAQTLGMTYNSFSELEDHIIGRVIDSLKEDPTDPADATDEA